MPDAIKIVLGIFGFGLAVWGLFTMVTGVGWVIDPQGFQMSNDADPFGKPPTFFESLWLIATGAMSFVLGGWLYVWLARRENAK